MCVIKSAVCQPNGLRSYKSKQPRASVLSSIMGKGSSVGYDYVRPSACFANRGLFAGARHNVRQYSSRPNTKVQEGGPAVRGLANVQHPRTYRTAFDGGAARYTYLKLGQFNLSPGPGYYAAAVLRPRTAVPDFRQCNDKTSRTDWQKDRSEGANGVVLPLAEEHGTLRQEVERSPRRFSQGFRSKAARLCTVRPKTGSVLGPGCYPWRDGLSVAVKTERRYDRPTSAKPLSNIALARAMRAVPKPNTNANNTGLSNNQEDNGQRDKHNRVNTGKEDSSNIQIRTAEKASERRAPSHGVSADPHASTIHVRRPVSARERPKTAVSSRRKDVNVSSNYAKPGGDSDVWWDAMRAGQGKPYAKVVINNVSAGTPEEDRQTYNRNRWRKDNLRIKRPQSAAPGARRIEKQAHDIHTHVIPIPAPSKDDAHITHEQKSVIRTIIAISDKENGTVNRACAPPTAPRTAARRPQSAYLSRGGRRLVEGIW